VTARQERRANLRAGRLAERARRSRGPADDAAIAWDTVRAVIAADRDPARQANRWKRVGRVLEEFLTDLVAGDRT
jgi:hypothetical protein